MLHRHAMRSLFAIIVVVWAGFSAHASAQTDGVRATSDNFHLMSDARVDAQTLLGDLEILRNVVLADLGLEAGSEDDPLRISIIGDMETFSLVTPSGLTAAAYRTSVISDDVIVGRSADPDHLLGDALDPRWLRLVLRHEVVHHIIDTHYPRKLPIWMGEGLAEYYSTFEIGADGQVTFGRALPEQQTLPESSPWLSMRTVIENMASYPDFRTASDGSAYSAQQLYYGQTFALAHFIMDQPNGLARIHRFVDGWSPDSDSEDSFERAFGLRYDPLEDRVRSDIVRDGGGLRVTVATSGAPAQIETSPFPPYAQAANHLRLLLTHGRASGRAVARIIALDAGQSDGLEACDHQLARALMAWRWKDWDGSDAATAQILEQTPAGSAAHIKALKVRVKVAYGRLGERQLDDRLWLEAEGAARRALAADPDDAEMHMFRVAVSRPETNALPTEAKASLDWLTQDRTYLRRPMTAMMMVPALLYEDSLDEADRVLDNADRWASEPSDRAVIQTYRASVERSRAKAAAAP